MLTKRTLALATAAIMLFAATAVFAGRGMGTMGGCNQNVEIETFKQFQKETSSQRDEMMVKRIEFQRERAKENPDQAKIATLKQEMTALRTQIHDTGKKYGMYTDCAQNEECWEKADCGMMGGGCGTSCGKNCGADCSKDCAKKTCGKAGCNKVKTQKKAGCSSCNKQVK
jgi:hypothetical protein